MQPVKSKKFRALHERDGVFILHNPWDVGSAKMLTALGAEALATTSAGYAFAKGLTSAVGLIPREAAIAHAREMVEATHLPVSADLENGYGHRPEDVAETIELAIEAGLAGCTIEDTTGDPDNPIYDRSLAIERIAAGVEAAKKLDENFMLCARAENYLFNRPDFDDTLKRLLGYQAVGADVLYAPGLPDLAAISKLCASVEAPVNVVRGIGLSGVSAKELAMAGVKRISAGSALARVAYGAMLTAVRQSFEEGEFAAFDEAASFSELDRLISEGDRLKT
ncbi:isocitrate lyase/PEP mutase family protein [Sneathiella glossodoripedis]|uniref:isocitrate lyase/PEP mutase family protein n=1 Tax=Sneathiella glossodoripedis TaxID=418853 RepID=UPI0011DDED73|nr:isocitrate lyase/phosphoenolpyruvate mutase family protein [Sneathiella glossodoripedis]